MDFTIFPPEFNSLNIQGSARPFLVAANAWKNLSNELSYAASRFESEINGLITSWRGPSSTIMAAAVAPFRAWIVTTASLAELVADHISVVAGAYEAAHAAHVPLPVIETNRLTRLALATTNIFGIHTPAIFALDALYAQYWSQDGEAMNLYATMAAAAARLTPFSPPAPIANPGALARLYELIGSVSETVGSFAAPATKNLPSKLWTLLTKGTYPLTAARISCDTRGIRVGLCRGQQHGPDDGQPRHAEPDTHAQGPAGVATQRGQARGVGNIGKCGYDRGVVGAPQLGCGQIDYAVGQSRPDLRAGRSVGNLVGPAGIGKPGRGRCGRRRGKNPFRSDTAVTRRRLAKGPHLMHRSNRAGGKAAVG